jgi:acyl-CoA thioesterase FadM
MKNNNFENETTQIDSNIYLRTTKEIITHTKKTFVYDFVSYLKDSNAYGNNYFAKYFEWQGVCREAWFYNCIAQDFLQSTGSFLTKSAHSTYKKETFPFQKIRCFVNVRELKYASFYLDFCFCDFQDESIVFADGYQHIVFVNKNHKPTKLPLFALEKITQYITK